jgi:hypothetical protein
MVRGRRMIQQFEIVFFFDSDQTRGLTAIEREYNIIKVEGSRNRDDTCPESERSSS